ncbi:hypothetical protein WJ968_30725 [Achromobacter xylosoxidans]
MVGAVFQRRPPGVPASLGGPAGQPARGPAPWRADPGRAGHRAVRGGAATPAGSRPGPGFYNLVDDCLQGRETTWPPTAAP